MTFPVGLLNATDFVTHIQTFDHFGEEGYEWIQIQKCKAGYIPTLVQKRNTSWSWKDTTLKLDQVAHFTLHWLQSHALEHPEKTCEEITSIEKIVSFMKKKVPYLDFDSYLQSVRRIQSLVLKAVDISITPVGNSFFSQNNTLSQPVLYFPIPVKTEDRIKIELVIDIANKHPGTRIVRAKKTTTVIVTPPNLNEIQFQFPFKLDFCLTDENIFIRIPTSEKNKPKLSFNLLSPNSEELFCKKFCSYGERKIMELIHQEKPHCAVPCLQILTTHFYERRSFPITHYLDIPIRQRLSFICDLLNTLATLHSIPLNRFTKNQSNGFLYHGNINLDNIAVFKESAYLVNFRATYHRRHIERTPFLRSPETAKFYSNEIWNKDRSQQKENILAHNLRYGRTNDVWALAICALVILKNKLLIQNNNRGKLPSLRCFQRIHYQYSLGKALFPDDYAKEFTQEELDQSVDIFLRDSEIPLSLVSPLIGVFQSMLKINPNERLTAAMAHTSFLGILENHKDTL